jgi:hypothetical protein
MSTVSPETPPSPPQPGLVKAVGILNLLIGGFLLLCGGGCLYRVVPPLLMNNPPRIEPDEAQNAAEEIRRQMIADLQDLERSAPAEADRERYRKSRVELESKPPRLAEQVDFGKVNADLPWLSRYLWADLLSGPVLNLLLLVSGIGLILTKSWGRALALGTAGLKIARLAVLNGFLAVMVVPHLSEAADQFARSDFGATVVKHAMDQQAARQKGASAPAPAAVQLSATDLVQVLRACGYGYAAMNLCLGAIYPAVVLIVLTRPGARAACARAAPDLAGGDFPQ